MRRFLPYKPVLGERASKLRRNMTQPEQKLWRGFLQDHQPRFRRQRMIKTFIVDFYCPAAKLVIEVDGESHFTEEGIAKDTERTAVLEGLGLYVLRFTNTEVMTSFEGVCQRISEVLAGRANVGPPSVPPNRGEDNRDFLNTNEDSLDSLRVENNRDFLSIKGDIDKITFELEEESQEDESLPFIEDTENRVGIDEDKNPRPNRGGQGGVKPQLTTGSRKK